MTPGKPKLYALRQTNKKGGHRRRHTKMVALRQRKELLRNAAPAGEDGINAGERGAAPVISTADDNHDATPPLQQRPPAAADPPSDTLLQARPGRSSKSRRPSVTPSAATSAVPTVDHSAPYSNSIPPDEEEALQGTALALTAAYMSVPNRRVSVLLQEAQAFAAADTRRATSTRISPLEASCISDISTPGAKTTYRMGNDTQLGKVNS